MKHSKQSLLPTPSLQPQLARQPDQRTRLRAQRRPQSRHRNPPQPSQSQPRNRTQHTAQSLQDLTAWLNNMSLLEPQNSQAPQSLFLTDSQHKYARDGISWEQFSKILDNLMRIYDLDATNRVTPHKTFKERLKEEIFAHHKRLSLTDVELSYAVTLLIKTLDMLENEKIRYNNIDCLFALSLRLSKFHLTDMSQKQCRSYHFYTLAFTEEELQENRNDCKDLFKMIFNYIYLKLDFKIHLPYSLIHPVYQCLYPTNALPTAIAAQLPNMQSETSTNSLLSPRLTELLQENEMTQKQKTAMKAILAQLSSDELSVISQYNIKFQINEMLNTLVHRDEPDPCVLAPKEGDMLPLEGNMLKAFNMANKAQERATSIEKERNANWREWSP